MNFEQDTFGSKLREILKKTSCIIFGRSIFSNTDNIVDHNTIAILERSLVATDIDVGIARRILRPITAKCLGKSFALNDMKSMIYDGIVDILRPYARSVEIDYALKPQVLIVCGVNGVGKTTTICKMATMLSKFRWRVTIGACDTFRDSASDQLMILASKLAVNIVTPIGTKDEPATVAYRAFQSAIEKDSDVLLLDTAGRLGNNRGLMDEFAKMSRVLSKLCNTAPHNVVMIIDASTGQNAKKQLAAFHEFTNITGIVLTKLDSSAKGGTVISLVDAFKVPVHGIGIGEGLEDLRDFSAEEFARNVVGL